MLQSAAQKEKPRSMKRQQQQEAQIRNMMQNPVFVIAHELYDALPIHQFEYTRDRKWAERMVALGQDGRLRLTTEHSFTENVEKVLRPEKLFGQEVAKEVKVGDTIEVCPAAASLTQEIIQMLEVSRGTALIIDYGEDHAFSNSFRVSLRLTNALKGIKDHKIVKEFDQIVDNIGQIDLTSYVNFAQIKKISESKKASKLFWFLMWCSSR